MKEIDDTDPPKTESEQQIAVLSQQIKDNNRAIWSLDRALNKMKAEIADLHHRRRISRQQATDQDPEWF